MRSATDLNSVLSIIDFIRKMEWTKRAFARNIVVQFDISPSRFEILKHAVVQIKPVKVLSSSDAQIGHYFFEQVR